MKKVLLTGGTGFVGANLLRRLLSDGHDVHLLLRPSYVDWRITDIQTHVHLHVVDFLQQADLEKVIAHIRPDWIFHLATYGAYSYQTEVQQIMQTNVIGTVNLVESCSKVGFEAFINTGSSSEYGFKDHAASEDDYADPNSCYAVAKLSATVFCRYTARQRQLRIPTLRLYSVFGPYEEATRLFPSLVRHGLRGELPPLVNPDIARDFVFVDDVVNAYLLAATQPVSDLGAVYNVGTGRQTNLRQLVELAKKLMNIQTEAQWHSMPNRNWDTSTWVANSTKIRHELGWNPQYDIEQGLKMLIAWTQLKTTK